MKISMDRFNCYLLLGLFLVYLSQPIFGISGKIGAPILVIVFAISSWYLVVFWMANCKKELVSWLWLLFLFYMIILYIVSGRFSEYGEMRQFLLGFLPFFAFYYFAVKNVLTEKVIKLFFFLLLVVFMLNMKVTATQLGVETDQDEFANNASYHIMALLPFVFLLKRQTIAILLMVLLAWYALGSMKRSVLIISLFSVILFAYGHYRKDKSAFKVKGFIVGILSLGLLASIGLYYYFNIGVGEKFEQRIMLMIHEGHTAGRDVLIRDLFAAWTASDNAFNYLFGLGYRASVSITSSVTHNDFIKTLVESGLVGSMIFILLLVALLSKIYGSKTRDEYLLSYVMFSASMVMAALTSRWYGASFFYLNCVLLPFLLVSFRRKTMSFAGDVACR